jgi:Domain of unknown function (DUF4397)
MKKLKFLSMIALMASICFTACKKTDPVVTPVVEKANVNVYHASPDAPGVDLLIDAVKQNTAALAFDQSTGYLKVTAGKRNVKVNATGTANSVINEDVTFEKDKSYTVVAANKLANIEAIVLTDDLTAPAVGKAHVRFVHLSPDAPAVDIFDGTSNLFANKAFKSYSAFTPVAAGTISLKVRPAGTTIDVLTVPVTLVAGKIYTIYAKGLLTGGTLGATLYTNN